MKICSVGLSPPKILFYLDISFGYLWRGYYDGLLEGRTLTRESNSEFTPRVSKLPTFPLLGFSFFTAHNKYPKEQEDKRAVNPKS